MLEAGGVELDFARGLELEVAAGGELAGSADEDFAGLRAVGEVARFREDEAGNSIGGQLVAVQVDEARVETCAHLEFYG